MRRKTDNYIALAAVCMLALSACTASDVLPVSESNQQDKTLIELTAGITGENPSATRAISTDPNQTSPTVFKALKFNADTKLYMVMKSEDGNTNPDATIGPARYTRTIGDANEEVDDYNTNVVFGTDYKRYYEDSYSRNSKISVYSACVPGNNTTDLSIDGSTTYTYTGTSHWTSTVPATQISWPFGGASVVGDQTAEAFGTIDSQDLCFSNNVSKYEESSSETDNRISFNTASNKFTSLNNMRLVFHHALTKVTFKIKKGSGFDNTSAFDFSNDGENIVLKGFNTSGTFNIAQGKFTSKNSDNDIKKMVSSTETGYNHVLTCLILPGTELIGTGLDNIYFTIDHNTYHITQAQLATALEGKKLSDGTTEALDDNNAMRPGVHYNFILTLGKTAIDKLTAAVVPWEEVEASLSPTNARVTVSLLDGTHKTGTLNYDFYRLKAPNTVIQDDPNSYADYTWNTGYSSGKGKLEETTANSGIYKAQDAESPFTQWYWEDNKTYYHFRAVSPSGKSLSPNSTDGDNISLAGENIIGTDEYEGVLWGAPFLSTDSKLTYSKDTGFDNTGTDPVTHQIYKAIGATNNTIKLMMFHMMSDVKIVLTSSSTTDGDYVNTTGAKMELTGIYSSGLVRMGNGKVETTGNSASVDNTDGGTKLTPWRHAFVPQSLDGVELTITTTDGNQYKVTMRDVLAAATDAITENVIANPYSTVTSGDDTGKYIIDYWYPNFKYTYTFKLTKTGIEKITATLANWETVIAGNDNVKIQ